MLQCQDLLALIEGVSLGVSLAPTDVVMAPAMEEVDMAALIAQVMVPATEVFTPAIVVPAIMVPAIMVPAIMVPAMVPAIMVPAMVPEVTDRFSEVDKSECDIM